MIDLQTAAPAVVVTPSDRGELTLTALTGQFATGAQQLSSRAISELPLNGRDFGTLLWLAAGTMTDANGAPTSPRNSPSTASAEWKPPSPWIALTSAIQRRAAPHSTTSM